MHQTNTKVLLALLLASACDKTPAASPGPAPAPSLAPVSQSVDIFEWAAGAKMVAAADLNSDQKDEWIIATPKELRVVSSLGEVLSKVEIQGGPQVLKAVYVDGKAKVVLATGLTVDRREAQARVELFELKDSRLASETIWEMGPGAQRQEIAAVEQRADGRLLIAYYKTRFVVDARTAFQRDGEWEFEPIGAFRMAATWEVGDLNGDSLEDVFVGTVYGEESVEAGGAFQLLPDGTRVELETQRGVRAFEFATFENQKPHLFVADGWHHKYRDEAEARLSMVGVEEGKLALKSLHVFEDELDYVVWEIIADPSTNTVLARTNTALYRVGMDGRSTRLASAVEDAALNSAGEILVVGAVPQVIAP